jgi:hypothetical protein
MDGKFFTDKSLVSSIVIKNMKQLKLMLSVMVLLGIFTLTSFAQSNPEEDKNVRFWFELRSNNAEESRTTFSVGEKIVIKTFLENYSNELFPFSVTDENYQYRFELSRVGGKGVIGYRKDKEHLLSIREEEPPGTGKNLALDPILPGNTQELETMSLDDRYENLETGTYKLIIEYKSGKIVQPDKSGKRHRRLRYEVMFEIVP